MIDPLLDLPSHQGRRLANALETGLLAPPYSPAALRSVLGQVEDGDGLAGALRQLDNWGVVGRAAAEWLRGIERAASRSRPPDVVWSGPDVPGVHARDTRRVFDELLSSANRTVLASTYAYFDGPKAFQALAGRMEARPELRVTLLLNIQRGRGDTTATDHLVRRFADRFWTGDWPGSRRPSVFYDPRSLSVEGARGVLHAKAVVVDDEVALITSANLTEAAFDHNIELGLLLRDRALAASISAHFRALIERGLLLPLPAH